MADQEPQAEELDSLQQSITEASIVFSTATSSVIAKLKEKEKELTTREVGSRRPRRASMQESKSWRRRGMRASFPCATHAFFWQDG